MEIRLGLASVVLMLSVSLLGPARAAGVSSITPPDGSTLTGASQAFSWTGTFLEYWMYVGTTKGAKDIYNSGSLGTATSTTVNGLPTDGSTVYVRLWDREAAGWGFTEFTYTAFMAAGGGGGRNFQFATADDTGNTTTSTTPVQVPDMSVTFTTTGSGPAVIWFNAELSRTNNEAFGADITITVDGNTVLSHTEDFLGEGLNEKNLINMNWVVPDLPIGTHTIAINWFVSEFSGVPGAEIRIDTRSLIVAPPR